jgi:parvulin-like peptidyl-prolyl isomerase
VRLSVLLAVLALVVAACDEGASDGEESSDAEDVEAVVNGEEIPAEKLQTRFDAMAESPQFAQQLEGEQGDVMETQLKTRILNQLVQTELLRQGAEELGVEADDEAISQQREQLEQQLQSQGQDLQTVMEQQGFSEEQLQRELEAAALQEAVVAELTSDEEVTDEDVAQYYEDNPGEFETAQARHILVDSEEQARNVLNRIESGEDFAAVAKEVSTDDRTAEEGGDLGEVTRSELQRQPALAKAIFEEGEPGELVGPVETQQGWHVIEVQERSKSELGEVEGQIRSQLVSEAEDTALRDWLQQQAQDAEVEVTVDFANWDGEAGQVAPEDGGGGMIPGQGQGGQGQGGQGQGQGGQGQDGQGQESGGQGEESTGS